MKISTMLQKTTGCSNLYWAILSLFLALTLCQVTWAQGDNLWNIRENTDDRFHDNMPWLRPWRYNYDDGVGQWIGYWSYEVPWGPVSTIGDPDGSFSIGRSRDHQFHVWTYVRVETAQTISLYGDGDCVPRVFVNYAFDTPIGFSGHHAILALNSGWNRIDITGYNQNDSYNFTCGALANLVDVMNSYEILNQPPVADAGDDQTVEQASYEGTQVTLDSSGSTDDGLTQPLTYAWTWTDGSAAGVSPSAIFPLGTTTVTLTVDDGEFTDSDTVIITVVDTTPPTLICPDDVTAEQESHDGTIVPLQATATDICDPNPVITSDELAIYPLGVTIVTFTATDASGNSSSCSMTVTVVDTTPPTINSVSADPSVLWPPNHKMVEVTVTVDSVDICDPAPVCNIVDVTSNEPINGLGDGDTEPDWEITADLTVNLRAERAGSGNGRIYTIYVECTDASGNTATATVEVTVPHDQGKGKK
ncbi:MAG: HYR domain-containing protein [Planctomycetota bacterium]|jgi:hypothetical protein